MASTGFSWHRRGEMRGDGNDDEARGQPSDALGHGQPPSRRWSGERIARLAFLAGLGWTAKRIAVDPLVRTTPENVYRVAGRYGLALSGAPRGRIVLRLPADVLTVVERAGASAGLTPAALLRHMAIAEARGPRPFAAALAG